MTICRTFLRWLILTATAVLIAISVQPTVAATTTIISFDSYPSELLKPQDAKTTVALADGRHVLRVATGHAENWPGITLPAPDKHWDLSAYNDVVLRVRNVGTDPITLNCRIDSPGGDGRKNSVNGYVALQPGELRRLTVPLKRLLPTQLAGKLYGMRGYPGGCTKDAGVDATKIIRLIIFVNKPNKDHAFEIDSIRASGRFVEPKWMTMPTDQFFPMIDQFGQFVHAIWPGKINSIAELKADIQTEQKELAKHPSPSDWDQYGGWSAGPQLKATGFFYPAKHADKWWLVDPEGRLFWSHGTDCVGFTGATTPITDREFYFADLPRDDSPLAMFYGHGSWAPHGYYHGKSTYRTYNFTAANLFRKYGGQWHREATSMIHRRLRSWAMNTIANWSDSAVYLDRKTPYLVSVSSGGAKKIEGSTGYWGKFPDPFDPSFRAALDRGMQAERNRSAGDPWCIGYFVDNEIAWGSELSLAVAALASPPDQAAKKVFLADLQKKYRTIDKLNIAWGTNHESWDALLACRTPPDEKRAQVELGTFYTKIAETYFRHCRKAVKSVAPNNLYLGCRFAWVNDRGARAAAKYCDVISYNLYRDSVADFRLPQDIDKPVIIGEFHFGALDRGMFHTGLRPTKSQTARAASYRNYVSEALKNPYLVGSHWFQYGDQATTGRGDGENYQIGLVNVCDRPYPETIAAVRDIGSAMYRLRLEKN